MHILIADDTAMYRRLLEGTLVRWGHTVSVAADGTEALAKLQAEDAAPLAILDWEMPGHSGIEVCQILRQQQSDSPIYIILLTGKQGKEELVAGLEAGADDYVVKPFDAGELRARINVGTRIVELQRAVVGRVKQLEEALTQVKQLQGLIPICAWCGKVRDDTNYWQQVEEYISARSDARFSHSICPTCYEGMAKPQEKPSA